MERVKNLDLEILKARIETRSGLKLDVSSTATGYTLSYYYDGRWYTITQYALTKRELYVVMSGIVYCLDAMQRG